MLRMTKAVGWMQHFRDKYTYKLLYTPNIAVDATIFRTHPICPKIKFTST